MVYNIIAEVNAQKVRRALRLAQKRYDKQQEIKHKKRAKRLKKLKIHI